MDGLDLSQAFDRVWTDKRDDAWPDVVGYHDFRNQFAEHRPRIEQAVRDHAEYRARRCPCLDIPKKGFTLRPGIAPFVEDRIVYQAIADLYAPHFEPEPGVYSNKLAGSNSRRMFQHGVQLWKLFQDRVEELCDRFEFVVETDIAAYFDHIFHNLLLDRVGDLFSTCIDRDTLQASKVLLKHLLGRWSGPTLKAFGIPQLNDASSFFGNLYLDEFDKWTSTHGYVCVRYVDDIRVFAHSEAEARLALAEVVVKLRQMGLYVASAKTRIRPSQETAAELCRRREATVPIESAFEARTRQSVENAVPLVEDLFASLVADADGCDDRLFRYCVNRLKRLKAWGLGHDSFYEDAILEVINRLHSIPQSTDIFVDFLSAFPESVPMHEAVLDFLEGPYSIYAWQQMHLLELLLRCDLRQATRSKANQVACRISSPRHHPACRSKAIILRGKNGSYADRRDIRDQYGGEPDESVRRAIVVAVQELQTRVRDRFYDGIREDSLPIHSTAEYVRSLTRPTYHYYAPPHFPDLVDDDSDDLADLGTEYFA